MPTRTESLLLVSPLIGLALLATAWVLPSTPQVAESDAMSPLPAAPPRPAEGHDVSDDAGLQQLLTEAPAGSNLLLAPGRYRGPLLIERGLTLWGPRTAVVYTSGQGTTVRLHGKGSAALGFSIEGSGTRYDLLDAGLELKGEDLRAEGLHITEAVYGIIANRSRRIRLRGNYVVGTGQAAMGLRGDGIRVWETYDSEISHNRMRAARDMVIWYSSNNTIFENEVRGCRYGTHLMYSHDNQVYNNTYVRNVVGLFSMYSRKLLLQNNIFASSTGSAGIGLGMKESSDLQVLDNFFISNQRGMYFDNSPFGENTSIEVRDNEFYFCSVALDFHDPPKAVILADNLFRANWSLIAVAGRGDALAVETSGNDFDSYRGYDLDHDGCGDMPFEERSMSEQLISSCESLALFRGTPASGMLEAIGQLLPLYRPKALLRDDRPAMRIPGIRGEGR